MSAFTVKDVEKMTSILEVFSQLDEIRWKESSNYNLINYCSDDLTSDEKLLTHWLCYITNRQMPFERIWDVGGYVVSHIVKEYSSKSDSGWKFNDVRELLERYKKYEEEKPYLECMRVTLNPILERYGINGEKVPFKSRYAPADIVLIYRTLIVLDKVSWRSFVRYINLAIDGEAPSDKTIKRIASVLNQLTYKVSGLISGKNLHNKLSETEREIANYKLSLDENVPSGGRKRLWCSLRDYLKSPEFNEYFVDALNNNRHPNPEKWEVDSLELKSALRVLELPGDVWNNAKVFRDGLFQPYLTDIPKSWDMPRTIRAIYELIKETNDISFYPEQLDVSFDFVPRMCQNRMCSVCLFGEGIEEVCHQKKGILCPVVLASCGYKHFCDPSSCQMIKNEVRDYCGMSVKKKGTP